MIERSSCNNLTKTVYLLSECIDRSAPLDGQAKTVGPLRAYRASAPTAPEDGVLSPVICVVAQGKKEVVLGQNRYVYGAGQFIVNSTPVPAMGRTIEATAEKPCLWISILIEPAIVLAVLDELNNKLMPQPYSQRCVEASFMELPLARAILKMAWLLDFSECDTYLSSLALKEVIYQLLAGPQANIIRQIITHSSEDNPTAKAIGWIRKNFCEPLKVEELAKRCGISPSMLHLRFKEVTGMSPLQFQKQLRLQEGKRLLTTGEFDVAHAGANVGYDSTSHFIRDYHRFFGDSPRRHVLRLLDTAQRG